MLNSVLCLKKSSVKQSISEILPYRNGCAPLRNLRLVMVHSEKSPKRADIKVG